MYSLKKDGLLLIKNLVKEEVLQIKKEMMDALDVFCRREETTDQKIISLFKEKKDSFLGWTNVCHNLFSLHRLASSKKIEKVLIENGIKKPIINTRPLISLSCKQIAEKESYWKVAEHQDWPSTRGSLNGVTIWIPLVDVDRNLGALEVCKGSHLNGLQEHIIECVPIIKNYDKEFQSIPMEVGDVLIFNYFTVHKSGENLFKDKIRWSAHLRYDDAAEKTFIERNFPKYKKEIRSDDGLDYSISMKEKIKEAINYDN